MSLAGGEDTGLVDSSSKSTADTAVVSVAVFSSEPDTAAAAAAEFVRFRLSIRNALGLRSSAAAKAVSSSTVFSGVPSETSFASTLTSTSSAAFLFFLLLGVVGVVVVVVVAVVGGGGIDRRGRPRPRRGVIETFGSGGVSAVVFSATVFSSSESSEDK